MMNAILCSALLALIFVTIFNTVPVEGVKCWICNHLGGCTNGYGEVRTCYNPTLDDPDAHPTPHPNYVENHREWCMKISFPGTDKEPERSCGRPISWNYGLNLKVGCQNVSQKDLDYLDSVKPEHKKLNPGQYCTCITGDECNAGYQGGEVTDKGEIDTPPPGHTVPTTRPMTMSTTPLPTNTKVKTTIKPVVPTSRRSDTKNVFDIIKKDQDRNKDRNGTDFDKDEYDDVYEHLGDTDWNNYMKSSSSAGIVTAVSCLVLLVCSPAVLLFS